MTAFRVFLQNIAGDQVEVDQALKLEDLKNVASSRWSIRPECQHLVCDHCGEVLNEQVDISCHASNNGMDVIVNVVASLAYSDAVKSLFENDSASLSNLQARVQAHALSQADLDILSNLLLDYSYYLIDEHMANDCSAAEAYSLLRPSPRGEIEALLGAGAICDSGTMRFTITSETIDEKVSDNREASSACAQQFRPKKRARHR